MRQLWAGVLAASDKELGGVTSALITRVHQELVSSSASPTDASASSDVFPSTSSDASPEDASEGDRMVDLDGNELEWMMHNGNMEGSFDLGFPDHGWTPDAAPLDEDNSSSATPLLRPCPSCGREKSVKCRCTSRSLSAPPAPQESWEEHLPSFLKLSSSERFDFPAMPSESFLANELGIEGQATQKRRRPTRPADRQKSASKVDKHGLHERTQAEPQPSPQLVRNFSPTSPSSSVPPQPPPPLPAPPLYQAFSPPPQSTPFVPVYVPQQSSALPPPVGYRFVGAPPQPTLVPSFALHPHPQQQLLVASVQPTQQLYHYVATTPAGQNTMYYLHPPGFSATVPVIATGNNQYFAAQPRPAVDATVVNPLANQGNIMTRTASDAGSSVFRPGTHTLQ